MAVRVLKKSCCCSLEIGTLVIAILGQIGGVGGIILAILGLSGRIYYNQDEIILSSHASFIIIGFSSIHLIFSILLIMAVKKRRSKLAIPWLVEMALSIVAIAMFSIYCLVFGVMLASGRHYNGSTSYNSPLSPIDDIGGIVAGILFMLAFGCLVVSGLNMYFWWIVFSFHQELKLEEETRLASVGDHGLKVECQNNYSKLNGSA